MHKYFGVGGKIAEISGGRTKHCRETGVCGKLLGYLGVDGFITGIAEGEGDVTVKPGGMEENTAAISGGSIKYCWNMWGLQENC